MPQKRQKPAGAEAGGLLDRVHALGGAERSEVTRSSIRPQDHSQGRLKAAEALSLVRALDRRYTAPWLPWLILASLSCMVRRAVALAGWGGCA
jgi:hypothetical protein